VVKISSKFDNHRPIFRHLCQIILQNTREVFLNKNIAQLRLSESYQKKQNDSEDSQGTLKIRPYSLRNRSRVWKIKTFLSERKVV